MMALGCGLAGAHRTGKTTLAKAVAEKMEIPFLTTSASKIATDLGIKIGLDMPFDQRQEFQEAALLSFEELYADGGESKMFITDRTPIDLAAYVMTAWHPAIATDRHHEWAMDYVKRCIDATNRWFFQITILQPSSAITFSEAEQKGENIDIYRESLNASMIGLSYLDEVRAAVHIVERDLTNMEDRIEAVIEEFGGNVFGYQEVVKTTYPIN